MVIVSSEQVHTKHREIERKKKRSASPLGEATQINWTQEKNKMGFLQLGSVKVTTFILGLLLLQLSSMDTESQASAQRLPADEVALLKIISSKMNNTYWTITEDSCSKAKWNWSIVGDGIISNVTCNCTFQSGDVCHVTNIWIKGFNLTGIVPDEFGNLKYLQDLDLSRNYLSGTIPKGLGKLPNLQKLSLLGNRISGSIPPEISNITSLVELILEDNLLTGPVPENIGNMTNLQRLLLSANNFTGKLPDTLGKLKALQDFRIDGNQLSGSIPEFIGNWTNITRLDLQGTSMQGPIPSTLSLLTNMKNMRITDLSGPISSFPDLSGMTKLERIALRNCQISGTIPEVFGSMTGLKSLDLSNNQLTGEVPNQLQNSDKLQYMFLNNNSLTGAVPGWIQNSNRNFDVSYNNFTGSIQQTCQQSIVNLVSSHSKSHSNSVSWCLIKDLPCSKKAQYTSLFINCGGRQMVAENNQYEEDLSPGGASNFAAVSEKWAYTSTGTYVGKENANYITGNQFNLTVDGPEYYKSARLAPQSLKYFGLCLHKGSYQVKLHFAEIMYSNNRSFSSIGRRIFDVAIQGNVVLPDFDIANEAGGVGIGIEREFTVYVNGSTLEIHLYWLGKGTTAIPNRGVYGPLISAITITPNFKVDNGGLSGGVIAGIVVSSVFVVGFIFMVLRLTGYLGGKDEEDKELRGLDLQTGIFTLKQIKNATNNFDPANMIGEGGFGPVYKGELSDGAVVAVKQLSAKSKQGNREFVNEIGMISALQHHNLVRLFGCCIEGNQLLLVYEYLENNSLARALFGREEQRLHLDWSTRKKILLGIAKGLAYLHEESRLKIVHRDIKATNVLLDKDLTAKISDFGLAKLNEDENTHISTRIAGTIGYMAPEYAMRGYLTDKADVYSFGIVALEIVSGKSNTNYRPKEEFIYLLDWAYVLQEQGNLLELVDPVLGADYSKDEAMKMLNLALLCSNPSPSLRPKMSAVVKMIEGKIPIQAPLVKRMSIEDEARFKAFEILSQDSQTNVSGTSNQDSQFPRSSSLDGPWADSSGISYQSKDESSFLEHSSSKKLLSDLYEVDLK